MFIIGHLRGSGGRPVFPIGGENEKSSAERLRINILGNTKNPNGTAQDRHGVMIRVCEATKKGYAEATVGDYVNLEFPNSKTRRGRVGKQVANTLLTSDNQGVVTETLKIRKLTPRECWRLQGFPDWAFDKAQEVNSNSQLYKQAGNSVTVNVIKAIAERLEK